MAAPTTSTRPHWWPRFRSPLRSTALTARLGAVIGVAVVVCMITGLLSHYQYRPWSWLPPPASPVWGYRVTQGVHVATGTATIPLVLVKLWSVYPNLFRWPPFRSFRKAVERLSVAILVSATLVQLATGFMNALGWYPFRWDFVPVHHALGYVVVGSVLLHVGVKLPDIVYGLQTRVPDGDVLTEIPWNENPVSHSNAGQVPPPATPALTRRGVLTATGAGVGLVLVTSVGQTVSPLERIGLLAIRQPSTGPQGLAVNRTAEQAQVLTSAIATDWRLLRRGTAGVRGRSGRAGGAGDRSRPGIRSTASRAGAGRPPGAGCGCSTWSSAPVAMPAPACGSCPWRQDWVFNQSMITGPQLERALLATHLNGERLNLDHGYPLRLIAPSRPGVLNTKWLARIEVR